ncbi:MAG: hypothetical protein ACLUD0_20460 [Eubacterium ramulus]
MELPWTETGIRFWTWRYYYSQPVDPCDCNDCECHDKFTQIQTVFSTGLLVD